MGELLALALGAGARRVVVGVGEGATHDAGAGMLAALGLGAPPASDPAPSGPLTGGGGALASVTADDLAGLERVRARWAGVDLLAACEVDLPLLGLHGASAAAPGAAARHRSRRRTSSGRSATSRTPPSRPSAPPPSRATCSPAPDRSAPVARLAGTPGAGAGGGLGFALALLGARVLPGAAVVADALDLSARLADVDLVVTGAERLDGLRCTTASARSSPTVRSRPGSPRSSSRGPCEAGRRELASAGIAAAYPVDDGVGPPGTAPRAAPRPGARTAAARCPPRGPGRRRRAPTRPSGVTWRPAPARRPTTRRRWRRAARDRRTLGGTTSTVRCVDHVETRADTRVRPHRPETCGVSMSDTTQTATHGVALTDFAAGKVRSLLEQEGRDDLRLRVAVQPGGCSGLIYQLYFDERVLDGDALRDYDGVEVVVDKMSVPYLEGATIDFADTIEKQGFTIDNPNAGSSCACGGSFA